MSVKTSILTIEEVNNLPVLDTKSKLLDKQIGRLNVCFLTERRLRPSSNRKDNYFLCLCSCGNSVLIRDSHLTDGSTVSCGCYIKEVTGNRTRGQPAPNRKSKGEAAFNMLVGNYKRAAKSEGRTFLLTKEECYALFKGNCHYCGDAPYRSTQKKGGNGEFIYNGIDRTDNNVGYEVHNVVSCCWPCNELKHARSKNCFLDHIYKIYNYQQQKIEHQIWKQLKTLGEQ